MAATAVRMGSNGPKRLYVGTCETCGNTDYYTRKQLTQRPYRNAILHQTETHAPCKAPLCTGIVTAVSNEKGIP